MAMQEQERTIEDRIAEFEDWAEEEERKAKSLAMWNLHVSIPNTGRTHGGEGHHTMVRRNMLDIVSHLRGETIEFNTALQKFEPIGIIGETDPKKILEQRRTCKKQNKYEKSSQLQQCFGMTVSRSQLTMWK